MFSFLFLLGHLSVERLSASSPFPLLTTALFLRITADRTVYDWRIAFTGMKWKQTPTTQEISSRLRIGLAQNVGGVGKKSPVDKIAPWNGDL